MSNIVGVQFQRDGRPNEYFGREYNYKTTINLAVGDVVIVPTTKGNGIAKVRSIDVPENKIDERILPTLKTIDRIYSPEGNIN